MKIQPCRVSAHSVADHSLFPWPSLGRGLLTVGEGDSFVREGGMIGFVIDNRRVRFDINQAAAEAAGLKISSKLLSVARGVKD